MNAIGYLDPYISYYKYEWGHVWEYQNQLLAKMVTDVSCREFKIKVLDVKNFSWLLPRLTACVTRQLHQIGQCQKLEGLEELFEKAGDRETLKEVIFQFLSYGGNPHVKFHKKSLISYCLDDEELLRLFVSRGVVIEECLRIAIIEGNLNCVQFLLKEGADANFALSHALDGYHHEIIEALLIAGADLNDWRLNAKCLRKNDLKLLKVLIQQGANLDRLLYYAVFEENVTAVKILLKRGANPNEENILFTAIVKLNSPIVTLLKEKKAALKAHDMATLFEKFNDHDETSQFAKCVDFLFDHFPSLPIDVLNDTEVELLLNLLSKKQKKPKLTENAFGNPILFNFIEHVRLQKQMMLRLGIDLNLSVDTGFDYRFDLSFKQIQLNNQYHKFRSIHEVSKITLKGELHHSVKRFFAKQFKGNDDGSFLQLFSDFCLSGPVYKETAEELVKEFCEAKPVFFTPKWSDYDEITIGLVFNFLLVFSTNQELPALHFYTFQDIKKLKPLHLIELQTSSQLLTEEDRNQLGLEKGYEQIPLKSKELLWDYAQFFNGFFLSLFSLPKEFQGASVTFLKAIKKSDRLDWLHKEWIKFDQDLVIENLLHFYEKTPEFKPNVPLLLFTFAKQQDSNLFSFLQKQKLKLEDFEARDLLGRNLFFYLNSIDGFIALRDLLESVPSYNAQTISSLLNTPCSNGYHALDNIWDNNALTFSMKAAGATYSALFLALLDEEKSSWNCSPKMGCMWRMP